MNTYNPELSAAESVLSTDERQVLPTRLEQLGQAQSNTLGASAVQEQNDVFAQ